MAYLFVYSSVILLPVFFLSCLQAQFTILSEPDDVVYVEAGKDLRLVVRFRYTGTFNLRVLWSVDSTTLLLKDYGTNVQEQVSLMINYTSLRNNDTYTFTWMGSSVGMRSYDVIIQVRPVSNISCAPSIHITEGQNFSCGCLGGGGRPPPRASWFKDNTIIGSVGYLQKQLHLINVNKDSGGQYICRTQSGTLTDEKSINLIVFYKPKTVSFTSNTTKNIARLGRNVRLTCVSDGNPRPNYTITFDGRKVKSAFGGILIIKDASDDDIGTYCCNATNNLGNRLDCFFLNVADVIFIQRTPSTSASAVTGYTVPSITPPGTTARTTFERTCQCDEGTEWYIIVVTLICGAIFGQIAMYLITFYLRRRRNARNNHKRVKPSKIQEGLGEKSENAPTYDELDLRKMNEGDNYQPLTKSSKTDPSKNTNYENVAAAYEELSKVRGNGDDSYQSLRRP